MLKVLLDIFSFKSSFFLFCLTYGEKSWSMFLYNINQVKYSAYSWQL